MGRIAVHALLIAGAAIVLAGRGSRPIVLWMRPIVRTQFAGVGIDAHEAHPGFAILIAVGGLDYLCHQPFL